MNIENKHQENHDFISDKRSADVIRVAFLPGTQWQDFESKFPKVIEYALTKKQENNDKRVFLRFDRSFEGKWDCICEILSKYAEELSNLAVLDFQKSDFPLTALLQLNLLYSKYENMDKLPIINMLTTDAHEEYKEILKRFTVDKKGLSFLKKVYFPGNRYFQGGSS